jgi:hypothetical protein
MGGQMKPQMLDGVGGLDKGDARRLMGPRKWIVGVEIQGNGLRYVDDSPGRCTKGGDGALYCCGNVIKAQDVQAGIICVLVAHLGL